MDKSEILLKKLNRRTRFTQFLVWIALFFTALGIAAGYKNWLRIHDKAKEALAGIAEIREDIPSFANKELVQQFHNSIDKRLVNSKDHLDAALKELRQIQDSTQHIADTVYTQVEDLTIRQEAASKSTQQLPIVADWSISEVHFLLQTAIQVLTIKDDKDGAIKALTFADQLLLKRGSADLLPLRKQISEDLALVKQYSKPDIEFLSRQISDMQDFLEPKVTLEKKEIDISELKKGESSVLDESESLVSRVKKTINDAVIIHKFDKPLRDEMDIESQKSLYLLLSLRFETLRIMLLQSKDKSYHAQIERIKNLLKTFYTGKDFKPLVEKLDKLDSVNLNPKVPDITKSLSLLESLSSKGNKN